MFKIGRISPPDFEWTDRDNLGRSCEWRLIPSRQNEVWVAAIDHDGKIGFTNRWDGMIEVYGDSEEMVTFLAKQIIDKLNDPKIHFKRHLKIGE
jgi:hypothetical protein